MAISEGHLLTQRKKRKKETVSRTKGKVYRPPGGYYTWRVETRSVRKPGKRDTVAASSQKGRPVTEDRRSRRGKKGLAAVSRREEGGGVGSLARGSYPGSERKSRKTNTRRGGGGKT